MLCEAMRGGCACTGGRNREPVQDDTLYKVLQKGGVCTGLAAIPEKRPSGGLHRCRAASRPLRGARPTTNGTQKRAERASAGFAQARRRLKLAWSGALPMQNATAFRPRRPVCCDSVGIRTRDPQLRRLLLYPTELRSQAPHEEGAKLSLFWRVVK